MNGIHVPAEMRHTTIMAEFNEMPGMRLTLSQAARLWSLAIEDCAKVLDDLVRAGFLMLDDHARYARRAGRMGRGTRREVA
jgi:DNA-binding IclR family transcriptional regulator